MNLRNYPKWRRPLVVLVLLPSCIIASITAIYYGNLHRLSAVDRITNLQALNTGAQTRVMVLAPHCDDETLGLGGLIRTLRDEKVPTKTVFFTNGDGFRIAAQFQLKKLNLEPSDYLTFGEARQQEANNAARQLGQESSDIEFLSFPDQSLLAMLIAGGPAPSAFVPNTTKSDRVSYRHSVNTGMLHIRENVINSLVKQLASFNPTDVYVTHPLDDHSDHAASPVFLQIAIDRGVQNGLFKRPHIHWYLVHRGDWPLPQGDHPDRWLVPPPAIAESGKQWQSILLPPASVKAKRTALACYVSQVNVMQRMLFSFLRKNEIITSGDTQDSGDVAALEPVGDNVARFANPSADISRVATSINRDSLHITTSMAGPCSPAIDSYATVVTAGKSGSNAFRFKLPRPQLLETQREITLSIPLDQLSIDTNTLSVAVSISTYAAEGLLVDRSAFHFVQLLEHGTQGNLHPDAKTD